MTWYQDGTLHYALGIEDTFVPQTRPGERALDEYELTEHYTHVDEDLAKVAEVGADMLRWGVPWYRVSPEPGRWDWEWTDRAIDRFGEVGVRPVIDLLHYGTPQWMDGEFAHPDFASRFSEFATTFAERYADRVTDYTPVNEPMIHAQFSGEIAYWPPYLSGDDGLVRMITALTAGFVGAQHGIAEVLGSRATFVHVEASLRLAGDLEGEHRELVDHLRDRRYIVEDLVTGRVGDGHPLLEFLQRHGMPDSLLSELVEKPALPDVMGVNYYPQHSTRLFRDGEHHTGGFHDPAPTQNDGVAGLEDLLVTYEERYGAPVALTETCVEGTVEERIAWMDASLAAIHALREAGHQIVAYTWWPLFDMYEWTYRHATGPRAESQLPMGLFDLVESDSGLLRRRNPVADAFVRHARGL
ncbi:family 1 glycosylhydrolase [Brachybacterium sp. YJGR34]|uniref:family 1 glycosylhydrolase n=1 Tax=Brachybacterium sp. YJGR34 TaxID=2059911 RepID=UPI000E09EBA9|nr:family 1 glycosylhydrolase [Brachybacterium sp. YJGR34]